MTKIKPVLLRFNQLDFNVDLQIIKNKIIPKLENIKTEFLKLGIGKLDDYFLKDILYDKMAHTVEVLEQEHKKKSSSRFLTKDIAANVNNLISLIYNIRNEIFAEGFPSLSMLVDFPSVDEKGNIVLSDEGLQNLKESHSVYTITEKGIELYKAHKKAAEALNGFYQLGKANINSFKIGDMFEINEEDNVVPIVQDYDLFKYARES